MPVKHETGSGICAEVPYIINIARETDGFLDQTPEAQGAIFEFASICFALMRDRNEDNRKRFITALQKVHEIGANQGIAIEVALGVVYGMQEEQGYAW